MSLKILILNGPNLNLLGTREPEKYGYLTLEQIKTYTESQITGKADLEWKQSNLEGELINWIQEADHGFDAIIINPAGYSHTSVAIRDALTIVKIPIIEVHLTNVYARESFRAELLTAAAASSIMSGLGKDTYLLAVHALLQREKHLNEVSNN